MGGSGALFMELSLGMTCHQLCSGLLRVFPFEEHFIDRFDYRHFDTMFSGEIPHRTGGSDAFCDHHHLSKDIVKLPSFSNLSPDIAVPAMTAHARDNQVADSRQSREGPGLCAQFHAEAGDFVHTAGHDSRLGVVPEPGSVANSSPDRDDVLYRPSQLHAPDIFIHIDAKVGSHEGILDEFGSLVLVCR